MELAPPRVVSLPPSFSAPIPSQCCHSYSHPRLSSKLSQAELDQEIKYSKKRLEKTTGGEIDCFAWVGGEEAAYSSAALKKMIQSGYRFVFATNCGVVTARSQRFCIERFHIEPTYMMFQTCFAISWAYVLGAQRSFNSLEKLLSKSE